MAPNVRARHAVMPLAWARRRPFCPNNRGANHSLTATKPCSYLETSAVPLFAILRHAADPTAAPLLYVPSCDSRLIAPTINTRTAMALILAMLPPFPANIRVLSSSSYRPDTHTKM